MFLLLFFLVIKPDKNEDKEFKIRCRYEITGFND